MNRYRAALIGCGGMSKSHLPALHEVAEIDVVAACDIDEGRLHAVGDAFNVENRYTTTMPCSQRRSWTLSPSLPRDPNTAPLR